MYAKKKRNKNELTLLPEPQDVGAVMFCHDITYRQTLHRCNGRQSCNIEFPLTQSTPQL